MPCVLVHKARLAKAIPGRPGNAYAIADKFFKGLGRTLKSNLGSVVTKSEALDIARAVKARDVSVAMRVLTSSDKPGAAKIEAALDATYKRIMTEAGKKAVAELDVDMSFSLTNPKSLAFIERNAANLSATIVKGAGQNITALVRASFTEGIPVDRLADLIQPHIGLHPNQAEAARRRRENALARGADSEFADRQFKAYSEQLLNQRAMRIARTEVIRAESEGVNAGWMEAQSEGFLESDQQQEWISGSESHGVCSLCAPLDGVAVLLGEPWTDPTGGKIDRPPLHVGCRCSIGLKF